MSVRIIITEKQYYTLLNKMNENIHFDSALNNILDDLNKNYEPMIGVVRDNGEYNEEPMIKIKADQSETTPKELFKYLKAKYKFGDQFIQQIIKDWMFGRIEDNKLSKNVSLS